MRILQYHPRFIYQVNWSGHVKTLRWIYLNIFYLSSFSDKDKLLFYTNGEALTANWELIEILSLPDSPKCKTLIFNVINYFMAFFPWHLKCLLWRNVKIIGVTAYLLIIFIYGSCHFIDNGLMTSLINITIKLCFWKIYFKAANDSHTERLCGQSETVKFAKLSTAAADSKDYSGILSLCKCCFGQIWF